METTKGASGLGGELDIRRTHRVNSGDEVVDFFILRQYLHNLLIATDNIEEAIINFESAFIIVKDINIEELMKTNIQFFLMNCCINQVSPLITMRALSCLCHWVENFSDYSLCFQDPRFIYSLMNIAINNDDIGNNTKSKYLAFFFLKRFCLISKDVFCIIFENNVFEDIISICLNCSEVSIVKEALGLIFFILRSEPHPKFDQVSSALDLFRDKFLNENSTLNDQLLVVAAAFIECGKPCALMLTSMVPISDLSAAFRNAEKDIRQSILYLFMTIFESDEDDALEELVRSFDWDIVKCIQDSNDSDVLFELIRLFYVSFQRSPDFILTAYNNKTIEYIFYIVENGDTFAIKRDAILVLMCAFENLSSELMLAFLDNGFLSYVHDFMSSHSTVVTKKTYDSLYSLYKYAESIRNTAITDLFDNIGFVQSYELIRDSEEVEFDSTLEEVIEVIIDNKLWVI